MKKNILVVDDSALMRRVVCDIIASDNRFAVADIARDGQEAYDLLKQKKYDAVVLDINMPKMNGLELLETLHKEGIKAKVIMNSTLTKSGADETMRALELGACDFVTKPENFIEARGETFKQLLGRTLEAAVCSKDVPLRMMRPAFARKTPDNIAATKEVSARPVQSTPVRKGGRKVVAVAVSTGGPKSLQSVLPYLPENLDAPVLLVQHMPAGFTATLAARLDDMSRVHVKEAEDGEELKNGWVYIAPGGKHLKCEKSVSGHRIEISDEPPRDALKPCANIMFESLAHCGFDEVTCVVLTGMGADGTRGIQQLETDKKVHVIAQDAATSVVYGMPRSVAEAGLVDVVAPLEEVADEITKNVGVR